jgi:GT2 family glycosyltransferase
VDDVRRRLGSRRVDLQRLAPAEIMPVGTGRNNFEWLDASQSGLHRRPALLCRPDSSIAFDLVLPVNARVVSWCALRHEGSARGAVVEFEICVRMDGSETSVRHVISAAPPTSKSRWHVLRIDAPAAGPARIVLRTRCVGTLAAPRDLQVLWRQPHVATPRTAADFTRALGAALASLRPGLWRTALSGSDRLYRLWARETEATRAELADQRRASSRQHRLFTLITFLARDTGVSKRTARSLLRQSYAKWEWIVLAQPEAIGSVRASLSRVGLDSRVRIIAAPPNGSAAQAWNAGLQAAGGDFAALLGPDDALAPSALFEAAAALGRWPDCDLLYSDEDRLSPRSRRYEPRFKPDWSPEFLLSSNYIGRLAVIRIATAKQVGAFRDGFDDEEEWDLFLRLSRTSAKVCRLPRCLYHRGGASAGTGASGAALRDHVEALGLAHPVVTRNVSPLVDSHRIEWEVRPRPLVSIVIPNRDAFAVLNQCVKGILDGTAYSQRELVIVDNGSTDPEVLGLYRTIVRNGAGRIISFDRPFNFSAACNAGAAAAAGDLLLFLNNDVEVIDSDWLDELVRWASRPEIGIVGAKLLYPDRAIQHAGVVFGLGLVGHIFHRASEGTAGIFGSAESYRNYLAVTGACQMMRRDVFERLGGFDERFRISFSDVVLCMEAWRAGYRVVYTPYARLVHHESYTRKRDDSAQDMELLAGYLAKTGFGEDPYLHPELNPKSLVPALRPPFEPMPRQIVRDYVERVLAAAPSGVRTCAAAVRK